MTIREALAAALAVARGPNSTCGSAIYRQGWLDACDFLESRAALAAPASPEPEGEPVKVCGKRCDHGSECVLLPGHANGHDTLHGCLFYDPAPEPEGERLCGHVLLMHSADGCMEPGCGCVNPNCPPASPPSPAPRVVGIRVAESTGDTHCIHGMAMDAPCQRCREYDPDPSPAEEPAPSPAAPAAKEES